MAAVWGATWRHLQGIEARSDERRRGDAWGEGRRRHAYGTRKNRRLERAHTNHGLLHLRNLRTFTGIYWRSQIIRLFVILPRDALEKHKLSNFIKQNHQSHQVTHQHVILLNEMVPQHEFTCNRWTLCCCLPVQVEQLQQPQLVMPVYPQAAVALNGRCGWAPPGGQESSSLHSILEKMDMIQTGQHTIIQAAFCYVFVLFPNVSESLPGDKVSASSIPPSFSSSTWASLILDQGM